MSINFTTVWDSDYWMNSNGMYCGFNMPEACVGEEVFGLPPYEKRKFYLADEYPACPKNWIPSEGRKTSYFVPVKEGHGMWLDFNKNNDHKYEVAIVISVQGVNPITGMPCTDAGLEQYIDQCPKHNIAFGPNRLCEKCGYKWPKQNYIATTGTPNGNLWLDGFRTADGIVRQYILTMDKIRGVAANIIKEDRVFAVGVSFFLSVNPKPVIQQHVITRSKGGGGTSTSATNTNIYSLGLVSGYWDRKAFITSDQENYRLCSSSESAAPEAASAGAAYTDDTYATNNSAPDNRYDWQSRVSDCFAESKVVNTSLRSVNVKKVEVGAGANINQRVHDDPEPLTFWRNEPEAIICINYCLESDCEKILKGGKREIHGNPEAFLKDIPVGN